MILLLNGSASDYFYPLYNFVGFIVSGNNVLPVRVVSCFCHTVHSLRQVQVFNPNEFPDVPSGSVSERLIGLGYETFIRIDSKTLFTDDETKRYSAESVSSYTTALIARTR